MIIVRPFRASKADWIFSSVRESKLDVAFSGNEQL
jgi:hypothetical protein